MVDVAKAINKVDNVADVAKGWKVGDNITNLTKAGRRLASLTTGQWAEKHGTGGDSVLWDSGMTPDNIPWTLGGQLYYITIVKLFIMRLEIR